MAIYYTYVIYILLISFISKEITNEINQKKVITVLLWLGLFLIMGLRAETVGNDLERYLNHFQSAKYIDPFKTQTETGYMFFIKLLNYLNVSRQGYVIIVSFIISSSFSWFFYKYSKNIGLSFFLHFTIGLFPLTMSGIRQSLAISITLFAIHFAIKRKLFYYLIFVFTAILFHASTIVFLPAYLLFIIKIKRSKLFLISFLLLIATFLLNDLLFSSLYYFSTEKYIQIYLDNNNRTGMNLVSVLFKITVPFVALLIWKLEKIKIQNISNTDISFFMLGLISVIFSILSLKLSIIERLSYYYIISSIVLIPNSLQQLKNRNNRQIIRLGIIIIAILYFTTSTIGGILNIDEYIFFWR